MNQMQTLNRLEKAYADLCAAIEWAYQAQEWQLVMDLVWELNEFLFERGHWRDQRRYLEYAIKAAQQSGDTKSRAQFQYALGVIAYEQGDYEVAGRLYREALEVFKGLH
jgi:tetratricopeptide (TPR) repeat protein